MAENIPPHDPHANDPLAPDPLDASEAMPAARPAGDAVSTETAPGPGPGKPARRRRRWPLVVGGIVAVLLLLVLLAPWIASTGPVRSMVLAQVNKQLNGRVEAADWSLGWTSGLKVRGVKVFDESNRQIVELASLDSDLSLLDVVRGNYSFGETTIAGLNVTFRQYADGTNNLSKLAKPSTEPDEPKESSGIPDVSGHFKLVECRGNYDQEYEPGKWRSVSFRKVDGEAKVPDLNSPIENNLTVVASVANAPEGTVTLSGSADLFDANQFNLDKAAVKEELKLANIDAGALAPFFPKDFAVRELTGVAEGGATVELIGGKSATLSVNFAGRNLGGALQNGDKVPADTLTLVVPPTSIDISGGLARVAGFKYAIGSGPREQIALKVHQGGRNVGSVVVGGRGTVGALQNLARNMKPGSAGQVQLAATANVGHFLASMPRTFGVRPSTTPQSGEFAMTFGLTHTPDQASVQNVIDLKNLKAVERTAEGERQLAFHDRHLEWNATTLGGGWQMPDLRDLKLALTGEGATGDFSGPSLTELNGTLKLVLQTLQQDVGQVVDFGSWQLRGEATVAVQTTGNLLAGGDAPAPAATTRPAGDPTIHVVVTARDLVINGLADGRLFSQKFINVDLGGRVVRAADKKVEALRELKFTARVGEEQQPTVSADVSAPEVRFATATAVNPETGQSEESRVATVQSFTVNRIDADLKRVQAELASFAPALKEWDVRQGAFGLAATGGYDGKTFTFRDTKLRLDNLTVYRTPQPEPGEPVVAAAPAVPVAVLDNYSLGVEVAGSYGGGGDATRLVLSQLGLSDNRKWISLSKAGQDNIEVVLPAAGGAPVAKGALQLGIELVPVNDILRRMSADPAAAVQLAARPIGAPAAGQAS